MSKDSNSKDNEETIPESLQRFVVENDLTSKVAGFAIGLSAKDTIEAIVYVIIVNPFLMLFKPSNLSHNFGYVIKHILTLLSIFMLVFLFIRYGIQNNLFMQKEKDYEDTKDNSKKQSEYPKSYNSCKATDDINNSSSKPSVGSASEPNPYIPNLM